MQIKDRLGRLLTPGDLVACDHPQLITWEFVGASDFIDPRVPAGAVELRFLASLRIPAAATMPVHSVVRIESKEEREIREAEQSAGPRRIITPS